MTPAIAEKAVLRRRMRILREGQPPSLAQENSLEAQARLTATVYWKNAKMIALYAACKGELSVDALMERAWQEGREVYLPRTRTNEPGAMDFVRCHSLAELTPSAFGLREPQKNLSGFGLEHINLGFRPDLLIVPGVAFDRQGMRLGFGGGYYDRFLRGLSNCPCVGICFEFQIVEILPADHWDCPVQYVCTEKNFWAVNPSGQR